MALSSVRLRLDLVPLRSYLTEQVSGLPIETAITRLRFARATVSSLGRSPRVRFHSRLYLTGIKSGLGTSVLVRQNSERLVRSTVIWRAGSPPQRGCFSPP